jgi:hypothetical protein
MGNIYFCHVQYTPNMMLKKRPFNYFINLILLIALGTIQLSAQNIEDVKKIKNIKDKKPLTLHGNLGVGMSSYFTNSSENRTAPFNWFVMGTPVLGIYGFQVPITLMYSETGRNLTHPFIYNFYGASPYYKWAKTHFGYRTMYFSDYTMSGMMFNGAGVELNPGKLRFGAFYGTLNPAVSEDTSGGLAGVFLPSYKRTAMGVKLGIGTEKNYFDVTTFKGRDNPNSLAELPLNKTIRPSDNVGLGVKFRFSLFKNWFLEGDGGISLFTKNILQDTLKGIKELEDYRNIFVVNSSTRAFYAGHMATGCQYDKWGITFQVREVSSDFQSMGIYFMQNDIREFTVSPNIRLFKGKLMINNSSGFYLDNVSDKRIASTLRKIFNTNITWIPNQKISFNAAYGNFGVSRNAGLVQQNDSLLFSLINHSVNTGITYAITQNKSIIRSLNVFANYQNADDRNEFTRDFNNSTTLNTVVTYAYNNNQKKWGGNGGISYAGFRTALGAFTVIGPTASINKSDKKGKFRGGANVSYSQRYKDDVKQGNILSVSFNSGISFAKKHQVFILANLLQNSTGVISNSLISEQRFSIKYSFAF